MECEEFQEFVYIRICGREKICEITAFSARQRAKRAPALVKSKEQFMVVHCLQDA